jgi:hypothetical protein
LASARPSIPGHAASRRCSSASLSSSVLITQRIAPRVRRCRTSARVSIPDSPGTPSSSIHSARSPSARHELTTGDSSRTMNPDAQIRDDSGSSALTPVLPICGAVMQITCSA